MDSTSLFKKLLKSEPLPTILQKEYVIDNGTLKDTTAKIMPNTTSLIFRHFKEIEDLPSYIALLDYMESSPSVKKFYEGRFTDKDGKVVKDPKIRQWLHSDFTMQFLQHYFDSRPIGKFDSNRFEQIYGRLEDHIHGELESRFFAPLLLFSECPDNYQITEKLRIRKIKPEDFSTIFDDVLDEPRIPVGGKYQLKYVAEYKFKKGDHDPVRLLQFLVGALRLFKTGSVSISTILQARLPNFGIVSVSTTLPNVRLITFGDPFKLTKEEARKFRKFFNKLKTNEDLLKKNMATSIRRFNSAIEHLNDDDKIIDFMISLEAMYSADHKQEMTFRVSSRVANLLAIDDKDALFIYEFMKQAYDRRSTLVHGGEFERIKVNGQVFNAHDSAKELERIARISIRKFLNLYMHYTTKENVNKALNDMIVTKAGKGGIRKNAKGIFD